MGSSCCIDCCHFWNGCCHLYDDIEGNTTWVEDPEFDSCDCFEER